jgi:hypothetical protein
MSKTRADVINAAHRKLGILSLGDVPSPDETEYASITLDGVIAELNDVHGLLLPDSLFDDVLLIPLSDLLASELAQHYSVPAMSPGHSVIRLRSILRPDTRSREPNDRYL